MSAADDAGHDDHAAAAADHDDGCNADAAGVALVCVFPPPPLVVADRFQMAACRLAVHHAVCLAMLVVANAVLQSPLLVHEVSPFRPASLVWVATRAAPP